MNLNPDSMRRIGMWALSTGVGAVAAVQSYSHIYDVALRHGGSHLTAPLLPISVDMLIVVGELMLLHEADTKGKRFVLGWVLVCSGIAATLFANISFGARFGIVGAVIWSWPAYSFVLIAMGMVSIVKRAHRVPENVPGAQPESVLASVPEVLETVTWDTAASVPETQPETVPGKRRQRRAARSQRARGKRAPGVPEPGKLPSLREIKRTHRVGTPRAREILTQMQQEAA